MITFGIAKKLLSKYAGLGGSCPTAEGVDQFVIKVLQYMLLSGAYGNIKKFCFTAQRGCFTLPRELEVPLKIKFDREVGTVFSRWFEFQSGNTVDDPCLATNAVLEEPNQYPTVYDIPATGGYPAVEGHCLEDPDAHVIVKGLDTSGREVFTVHKGEKISGVYLTIKKDQINKSDVLFGKITEVYKTRTNGYVTLLSVSSTVSCVQQYLADYTPYDQTPSFRRIRLLIPNCPPICKITVLGRIKIKDYYADDDLIPFDNYLALTSAAQTVNDLDNSNLQNATVRDQFMKGLIENEGNYKKVNVGIPLEVFYPLSGGAIKGSRFVGWNGRRGYGRR